MTTTLRLSQHRFPDRESQCSLPSELQGGSPFWTSSALTYFIIHSERENPRGALPLSLFFTALVSLLLFVLVSSFLLFIYSKPRYSFDSLVFSGIKSAGLSVVGYRLIFYMQNKAQKKKQTKQINKTGGPYFFPESLRCVRCVLDPFIICKEKKKPLK